MGRRGGDGKSSVVNITVSTTSNQLPTVSITSPISGQSFAAPASLTITAAASDSDGSIAKVEFYAGSQLIATDTTSQYQAAWNNVAAGSYSLKAVAYDNRGGTRESGAVAVTITAAAPTPTRLVFTASADHETSVSSYTVAIYRDADVITTRARSPRATSASPLRSGATSRSTSRRSSIRCRPEHTRPSCARRVQEARPPARRRRFHEVVPAQGSRLKAQEDLREYFLEGFPEPEP